MSGRFSVFFGCILRVVHAEERGGVALELLVLFVIVDVKTERELLAHVAQVTAARGNGHIGVKTTLNVGGGS